MVVIGREQHILRKVDLYAVTFPDGDGGRDLHESVKDGGRGLGDAGGSAIGELLRAGAGEGSSTLRDLRGTGNDAKSNRRSKDLQIMVVHNVLQAFLANLIETVKLVEIDAVAIRHNHPVEDDSQPALLAESGCADLLRFAQHDGSIGNQHMLVVVRVDGIRDEHLDRPNRIAVQPVHQNGVHRQPFIDHIRLSDGGIDVYLRPVRERCLPARWRR